MKIFRQGNAKTERLGRIYKESDMEEKFCKDCPCKIEEEPWSGAKGAIQIGHHKIPVIESWAMPKDCVILATGNQKRLIEQYLNRRGEHGIMS